MKISPGSQTGSRTRLRDDADRRRSPAFPAAFGVGGRGLFNSVLVDVLWSVARHEMKAAAVEGLLFISDSTDSIVIQKTSSLNQT